MVLVEVEFKQRFKPFAKGLSILTGKKSGFKQSKILKVLVCGESVNETVFVE